MPALATLYTALGMASGNTAPIRRHLFAVFEDPSNSTITHEYHRDSLEERAIFSVLTCVPLIIVCYLFWRRVRNIGWRDRRHISYIRCLVYTSYLVGIVFLITDLGLSSSGLHTPGSCRTAIYLCILFLFLGKLSMQLFLIERAHVANINYLRRRDDPMWKASIASVLIGGSFLAVWTYLNPIAYISKSDGKCRKGLPREVVAPIEVYEFFVNTILTTVFVIMLRRTRQCELFPKVPEHFTTMRGTMIHLKKISMRAVSKKPKDQNIELASNDPGIILPASSRPSRLHSLAYKSLIGTILILAWGIANSTIFYITDGREKMWLCFTQCTMDIFLSICVLHWLTTNPKDDHRLTKHTRPSVTELPQFMDGETSAERNANAIDANTNEYSIADVLGKAPVVEIKDLEDDDPNGSVGGSSLNV